MLSKVNKDNPIFVSFLLYFVPTPPLILTPLFFKFSKSLKPPPPPLIMNLRVVDLKVRGLTCDFYGVDGKGGG